MFVSYYHNSIGHVMNWPTLKWCSKDQVNDETVFLPSPDNFLDATGHMHSCWLRKQKGSSESKWEVWWTRQEVEHSTVFIHNLLRTAQSHRVSQLQRRLGSNIQLGFHRGGSLTLQWCGVCFNHCELWCVCISDNIPGLCTWETSIYILKFFHSCEARKWEI